MSKIRNWVPSSFENQNGRTLLSTDRYENVNWTTFLDPTTDYKTTVYVIETWTMLSNASYDRGTTMGIIEVARPAGQTTGWCVRLYGEELPERYASKGLAQHAAEGIAK